MLIHRAQQDNTDRIFRTRIFSDSRRELIAGNRDRNNESRLVKCEKQSIRFDSSSLKKLLFSSKQTFLSSSSLRMYIYIFYIQLYLCSRRAPLKSDKGSKRWGDKRVTFCQKAIQSNPRNYRNPDLHVALSPLSEVKTMSELRR